MSLDQARAHFFFQNYLQYGSKGPRCRAPTPRRFGAVRPRLEDPLFSSCIDSLTLGPPRVSRWLFYLALEFTGMVGFAWS